MADLSTPINDGQSEQTSDNLITQHIDIWTTAIERKSSAGRGTSKKFSLYGIKKLRELILELAVRGKLVPQILSDESPSVLLDRISAEKAQLVNEGKIKKPKVLPEISDDEKSFELPNAWNWLRLADIGYWAIGSGFPKDIQGEVDKEVLVSKVSDMNLEGNNKYIYSTNNSVDLEMAQSKKLKIHQKGTVIFPKIGGAIATNKRRIIVKPTVIDNNCLGITPYSIFDSEYLYLHLKSIDFVEFQAGTSVPALSQAVLELITLGVPPLEEQHRIVAKVDELMSLCDALEAQTEASISAHQTLVETLLNALLLPNTSQAADSLSTSSNTVNAKHLNAASLELARGNALESSSADSPEPSFAESWQRVAEHFDTLFTTEASIDTLKQTILQLAVMGKLVPWNEGICERELKEYLSFGPRNGFSPKEASSITNVRVLKLGATTYGDLDLNQTKYVDVNVEDNSHLWLCDGDILIQRGNSANYVGCNCLVRIDVEGVIYPDLMMKLRTVKNLNPEFLSIWLSSPKSRQFMWDRMTGTSGTMPKISKKIVEAIPIIVPSLEEQHRIVARVDELMTLCDQLKARLTDAQTTQLHLTDAIVEQAVN
ncbi:MAG: restriction endonuclease subunit S [Oceanospirillaceae bacterium]|jgi:type I restriction enzyme S subunit